MTSDYSYATVYFTVLGSAETDEEALEETQHILQSHIQLFDDKSNISLIISHWDCDHYNLLCVADDSFFENINNLQAENEELKKKNSELEQALREFEIVKSENETLKEYVNLKDKYGDYETIPAYVINRDLGNYSNTVVINVGEKDGIEENMTVIADEGLVGHVISTTENTAKVQTLVDTATAVTSTISTTKDTIIVQGTLDDRTVLKATYIPTDASILQGDNVETSGIGGIYPKGVHIGTIKEVFNTKNITDRYATVETAVDFSKLATVLVILNNN